MENDPAAEFLAREQQQLADLDDVGDVVEPASGLHQYQQNGFAADQFDNASNNAAVMDDDDFMLLGGHNNVSHMQNGGNATPPPQEDQDDRDYSYRAPAPSSTPESVRKWREEQVSRLKTKDQAEEDKNRELRGIAQKELDDWYRLWNDNLEKRKKNNREHERSVSEANSGEFGNSSDPKVVWERIATLCDFSSSQKATTNAVSVPGAGPGAAVSKSDTGTRDVSRMKSLLLQLKQKPPKQTPNE